MQIHHIGYLVKKIDKAIEKFKSLGFGILEETMQDDIRKINICFLEKDGYVVELVSPFESNSVVSGLIKRYGNSPYHICYKSKYFDTDVENLCKNGYTALDKPCIAPAISNKKVIFLVNPDIGIIEILEG